MGDSIGTDRFPSRAGTFGGYLELFGKQGFPEKICGLTCHHVLRPYDETKHNLPPKDRFGTFDVNPAILIEYLLFVSSQIT